MSPERGRGLVGNRFDLIEFNAFLIPSAKSELSRLSPIVSDASDRIYPPEDDSGPRII